MPPSSDVTPDSTTYSGLRLLYDQLAWAKAQDFKLWRQARRQAGALFLVYALAVGMVTVTATGAADFVLVFLVGVICFVGFIFLLAHRIIMAVRREELTVRTIQGALLVDAQSSELQLDRMDWLPGRHEFESSLIVLVVRLPQPKGPAEFVPLVFPSDHVFRHCHGRHGAVFFPLLKLETQRGNVAPQSREVINWGPVAVVCGDYSELTLWTGAPLRHEPPSALAPIRQKW